MGDGHIKNILVAIDGPGGAGKSTVARGVARRLGLRYVDTGAMYRAVSLAAHDAGIDPDDEAALKGFLSKMRIEYDISSGTVSVNGRDLTDRIRTPEASRLASIYSQKRALRKALVRYQKALAGEGGVVMEGRDIGTVVLPDAEVKIFLDASPEVRAKRRHAETPSAGKGAGEVLKEIKERDRRDSTRMESPLVKAPDAVYIDTTGLKIGEVVKRIVGIVRERSSLSEGRRRERRPDEAQSRRKKRKKST